jgi:hypothetical protein
MGGDLDDRPKRQTGTSSFDVNASLFVLPTEMRNPGILPRLWPSLPLDRVYREGFVLSLSPIRKYLGSYGPTECVFESLEILKSRYLVNRKRTSVAGTILYHRYHDSPERMSLLVQFVEWLAAFYGVRIVTLQEIYQVLHPESEYSWSIA